MRNKRSQWERKQDGCRIAEAALPCPPQTPADRRSAERGAADRKPLPCVSHPRPSFGIGSTSSEAIGGSCQRVRPRLIRRHVALRTTWTRSDRAQQRVGKAE
ncbi:hypothetical protein NDU88_007554 [Pleurodeles waltl]|uniref:Uncharacterized protein n=1 Tax=Pleurodeles waltl TaxID=8319 RepID=A0AAV7MNA7_PLEWA|nr:hypothetical protein NDU88_007554 [Pleurodeles waltl]